MQTKDDWSARYERTTCEGGVCNNKKGETIMKSRGVYQSQWMWEHGIPPMPLWLVGWFVIPLEAWRHRRAINRRSNDD